MQELATRVESAPASPRQPERLLTELLSWPEIRERFPDGWVCVVDLLRHHRLQEMFSCARVVAYSKDRNEIEEAGHEWLGTYWTIGHYFTGQVSAPPPPPEVPQRMITELLTWAEICERFPEQWVSIVEGEYDDPVWWDGLRRGKVVGASATRAFAWRQADLWRETYFRMDHYFTGEPLPMTPEVLP